MFTVQAKDSSTGTGPFTGSRGYTLTVDKALATVSLGNLTPTYDGTTKSVTFTTVPSGLAVSITYNGNPSSPTVAGSYSVVVTIAELNYKGSATGTLLIGKATPVITWPVPGTIFSGTALSSDQLNATANVSGTFAYTQPAGTLLQVGNNQSLGVQFTPTDTANYTSASASVSINVLPNPNTLGNQPPQFTLSNPNPAFVPNNVPAQVINGFATGITAGSGEDYQSVHFAVQTNPAFFTSNGAPAISPNGTLTYTPNPYVSGPVNLNIQLFDDGKNSDGSAGTPKSSSTVLFTLNLTATPPAFLSPLTSGGMVGAKFTYPLSAAGGGTMSYTMTTAPSWMTLTGNQLSGTPPADGTFNTISMTASNGVPPNAFAPMTFVVVKQLIISTYAGGVTAGPASGDGGPATAAVLNQPAGVALDSAGNGYIADTANNEVRMVTPGGIITTIAGGGSQAGDGIAATTAKLNNPSAVVVDNAGILYICEPLSNRIRKVSLASGIISTLALNNNISLAAPSSVAFDNSMNMYIADNGNHRVVLIDANQNVTVFAGGGSTAGAAADGGLATAAKLNSPYGVAADSSGNVYIADLGDQVVRMVNRAKKISTIAGQFGVSGSTGDGGPATSALLSNPQAVAVDAMGNIYIADTGNNRLRKILGDGTNTIVTLVNGSGLPGFSGDNDPSFSAQLNQPAGVAVSAGGNTILIADQLNSRIRRIAPPGPPIFSCQPVASSNPVRVKTPVVFTCAATGSPQPTLVWDFGDGTALDNSNTSTPTHTYTQYGTYIVTVTATAPGGAVVSATLSETVLPATRVPLEIMAALHLDPNDPAASPLGPDDPTELSKIKDTLTVKISSIKLYYMKPNKDSISFQMSIAVQGTPSPNSQSLVLDFGKVVKVFTLKQSGAAITATDGVKSDVLKVKMKGSIMTLSGTFTNEDLVDTLMAIVGFGEKDIPGAPRHPAMKVYVLYAGYLYENLNVTTTYIVNTKTDSGSGKSP